MKDAEEALAALSDAFRRRDVGAALACFADSDSVTYCGSEAGEVAQGRAGLLELFSGLFARQAAYSWTPERVRTATAGACQTVVADLVGKEHRRGGSEEFPYRISGVLESDGAGWRWLLVTGCEPTGAQPFIPGDGWAMSGSVQPRPTGVSDQGGPPMSPSEL